MSGTKIFTAAIIGCGDIGYMFDKDKGNELNSDEALTHFRALNISEHFRLVSAADSNVKALSMIDESEFKKYDDYKKMLEDLNPDVVTIATNDESHYPILIELFKIQT
ncbi:MAG: Gfo/Idh/MocA family oxidoreductase [Ignavibacteria bacterium]|nr:Gfo/Idh/MocA family oxidoreductase [Ignavibacteria bacterium]